MWPEIMDLALVSQLRLSSWLTWLVNLYIYELSMYELAFLAYWTRK
jgi:hypothetical protein